MTLVAVPPFGLWATPLGAGVAHTGFTLDAANEKVAVIFQAPRPGTIDRVSFRTATVTTGETVAVRLETVAADGTPSGSLWAANTSGSVVVDSADDNVWKEATLTAGAVVAQGAFLALVVSMPGVTSGNLQVAVLQTAAASLPHAMQFTGSWVRNGLTPVGAIRYDDGSYAEVPGLFPFLTISLTNFNSGTNPDERGNKITVPFACKVRGAWRASSNNEGDYTLKLYDAANVVLSDLSVDGNFHSDAFDLYEYLSFDNEVTLAAGEVVRLTTVATTATASLLADVTCPAGMSAALPGGGQMIYTTRNDAGAWTDTADRMAMIGLILSALDDGAGGGGTTQGNLGSILRGVAH